MLKLNLYRKEKREFVFTLRDKDGDVIPLLSSNVSVKFRVYTELPPLYGTKVFEVDATGEADDGTCTVTLTETQTDITPQLYSYEIYCVYPGETEYVAEVGLFLVRKRADASLEGKTFCRPEDVRLKLRWIGDEYDYADEDLQFIIEEAHRKMILDVGINTIQKGLGHYNTDDKVYYLPHGELISFDKIYINGGEVSNANYTVNYDKGMITFDSDYSINYLDTLEFTYIPYVYRDLEILYAIHSILMANYVQSNSSITNVDIAKIEEEMKQLRDRINNKGNYGTVLDYSYRGGRW